jgi:hypothetical protein
MCPTPSAQSSTAFNRYHNLSNISFDLAGFCKTVQAFISKDAKTLQSCRPNSAWGANAFVTARVSQNPFKRLKKIHSSGIKLHQKVAGQKFLLVGLHAATENDGA